MHLKTLSLRSVRSIASFSMDFGSKPQGWHVVIGNNGAGKSAVIRAIALALIGPQEAPAARQEWSNWLRVGSNEGEIKASFVFDPYYDSWTGTGRLAKDPIDVKVVFQPTETDRLGAVEAKFLSKHGLRTIWGAGLGWFCSSFGPFRRFTGGDPQYDRLFYSNPKLAPHLSVFGEDVALTECL